MANADAVRGEGGAGEERGEVASMGRSEGGQRWGGAALGGVEATAVSWRSDGHAALDVRLETMRMRDT